MCILVLWLSFSWWTNDITYIHSVDLVALCDIVFHMCWFWKSIFFVFFVFGLITFCPLYLCSSEFTFCASGLCA